VAKATPDVPTKETPPAALPGAQTNADTVAPSDRPAGDLAPTEALFDAVDRGDITAARDAIKRGADLDGHDVLDMTPLELSVDLGRKDITFLLLSLRGIGGTAPAAAAEAAPAKPGATHPAHAVAQAKPAHAKQPVVAARPATSARQYAGAADGGTPIPQAGFLGFGGKAQP
jgi:hypothetical protein